MTTITHPASGFVALARQAWAHSMAFNRTTLFDALAAQRIMCVTVELHPIDTGVTYPEVDAIWEPEVSRLHSLEVPFVWHKPTLSPDFDGRCPTQKMTIEDALLELSNDLLLAYDAGAGAHYCKLLFYVTARKIELRYGKAMIELDENTSSRKKGKIALQYEQGMIDLRVNTGCRDY